MKSLTVRLPESIVADIEIEARGRGCSMSDVVRERLQRGSARDAHDQLLVDIADLIGAVDGLPADLSARKKDYLTSTGYGRKRDR
jgi:Arc/MetJ-type ribon-helix-helix transcriptional regulator